MFSSITHKRKKEKIKYYCSCCFTSIASLSLTAPVPCASSCLYSWRTLRTLASCIQIIFAARSIELVRLVFHLMEGPTESPGTVRRFRSITHLRKAFTVVRIVVSSPATIVGCTIDILVHSVRVLRNTALSTSSGLRSK